METKDLYLQVGDESYIDIPKLYDLKCDVYIVFGERSAGKTFSVLKGCFNDYERTGAEFIYMRTREDYLIRGRAFAAVANIKQYVEKSLWREESLLTYYSGAYRKKSLGRKNSWEYEDCGYSMSIGGWIKYKGSGYDKVKTIFLDEFIEDTDTTTIIPLSTSEYLKGWTQNLSTIVRKRKGVRVVCCANSINAKSPIFTYYNIDARHIEQGKIYIFKRKLQDGDEMKICVLYTEPPKRAHVDKHIAIFESETSDMTTTGSWQESLYPMSINGKSAKSVATSKKHSRLYLKDINLTFYFPSEHSGYMCVLSGKHEKNTIEVKDLYLPTCQHVAHKIFYYVNVDMTIVDTVETSRKLNDLLTRIKVDKK